MINPPATTPTTKRLRETNSAPSLQSMISNAKRVLVVVGAGISTSAGLPDFRSPGTGLYATTTTTQTLPAELLFDIEVFTDEPSLFYAFARTNLFAKLAHLRPTRAHAFLASLSTQRKLLRCYTQNIDGLESLAGVPSKELVQVHGSLTRARCMKCSYKTCSPTWWDGHAVPECPSNKHPLRPDIVMFGESVGKRALNQLDRDVNKCDLALFIGTSLSVFPISTVVHRVGASVPCVWISRTPPPASCEQRFNLVCIGDHGGDGAVLVRIGGPPRRR
jgi:NAD-dependent SIR2 family protein deacetylase